MDSNYGVEFEEVKTPLDKFFILAFFFFHYAISIESK